LDGRARKLDIGLCENPGQNESIYAVPKNIFINFKWIVLEIIPVGLVLGYYYSFEKSRSNPTLGWQDPNQKPQPIVGLDELRELDPPRCLIKRSIY
jgi:hypothetical protein